MAGRLRTLHQLEKGNSGLDHDMDSHPYFTKHITVAFKSMTKSWRRSSALWHGSCEQGGQTTRCPFVAVSGQRPESSKEKTQTDSTCIAALSLEDALIKIDQIAHSLARVQLPSTRWLPGSPCGNVVDHGCEAHSHLAR